MMIAVIRTPRLIIRRWRNNDHEPFAAMNADERVMEYFPSLLTREESDAMIVRAESHFDAHDFAPFALELLETGQFLGFTGLMVPSFTAHFTPCVEIGWRLAHEHWNKGYATEAASAVLQLAFQEIGLAEVVSFTTTTNFRSRRVMEKLSMTRDPADDFPHPKLAASDPLSPHVLYRLKRTE
jgi:RimJ/RimL family protein N-acetyltransferase